MIQKTPKLYLAHLRNKRRDCPYHQILYDFLETIFKDFHATDHKHLAFYETNSKAHLKAARWVAQHGLETATTKPSRALKVLQPIAPELATREKSPPLVEAIAPVREEDEAEDTKVESTAY